MTTRNVGTAYLLTPAQKCTEHAVIFQDSKGLPNTDDPLIGEKSQISNFPKSTKEKNCFQLIEQILKKEKITTLERAFLV